MNSIGIGEIERLGPLKSRSVPDSPPLISSWQLNLARRISQIMTKPGTYNFQIELDKDGRKVFRWLNGERENLGK